MAGCDGDRPRLHRRLVVAIHLRVRDQWHGAALGDRDAARDFGEGRVLMSRRTASGWQRTQQLEGQIYAIGSAMSSRVQRCTGRDTSASSPAPTWSWSRTCRPVRWAATAVRGSTTSGDGPIRSHRGTMRWLRGATAHRSSTSPIRRHPAWWGRSRARAACRRRCGATSRSSSNHAYIVADGAGPHGMQVFDLTPAAHGARRTRRVHARHDVP